MPACAPTNRAGTLLTQAGGIHYLLSRLVWVHHLNIDPDLPVVTSWNGVVAPQVLFLLMWLAIALIQWRQRPWLLFCLLLFFLHLTPTNSLLPRLDVANERHLYLAHFGLFFPGAVVWFRLSDRLTVHQRLAMRTLGLLLIPGLCAATYNRNGQYEYQISLWLNTVQISPNKARAHNNLGFAYETEGQTELARHHYQKALELNPEDSLPRKNLARLARRQTP